MSEPVTTWGDAKIAAWEYLVGDWPDDELGPVRIAPWGWESPRSFVVTVTNAVADGVWVQIDRPTGEVSELTWADMLDLKLRMAKVGDWSKAPV